MKIKIEEKQENLLLNRQDISFLVDHAGDPTPPRNDVRAKLAAMLNCKEDLLYVIKFRGQYGQSLAYGYAHLYPSKEVALSQEQKHIIKRHATKTEVPSDERKPTPQAETPPEKKEPDKPPAKEAPKAETKKEEPKAAPTKEATPPKTKSKPKEKKTEKPSEKKETS